MIGSLKQQRIEIGVAQQSSMRGVNCISCTRHRMRAANIHEKDEAGESNTHFTGNTLNGNHDCVVAITFKLKLDVFVKCLAFSGRGTVCLRPQKLKILIFFEKSIVACENI